MGRAAKIYAEQLGVFEYGHPLWYPEPTKDLDGGRHGVQIGDVGYIDPDGAFRRLFNITFEATHHFNTGGVPEDFVPLLFDQRWNDVKEGFLNPGPMCSKSVRSRQLEGHASGAAGGIAGASLSYKFECLNQEGALLVLRDYATKASLGLDSPFEKYMLRNHQSWCNFIANLGVRLEPEDIILVRGTVKTSSWAVAAFFDAGQHVHEVTFDGQFGQIASLGVKYSQKQGAMCSFEQRVGPYLKSDLTLAPELVSPETRGADQCVFLSYYKVKYRKFFARKIVANAEFLEPPGYNDSDEAAAIWSMEDRPDVELEIEPDVQRHPPRSPLDEILDYILENCDATMAIASHADVERLVMDAGRTSKMSELLRQKMPKVMVDVERTGKIRWHNANRIPSSGAAHSRFIPHQSSSPRDPEIIPWSKERAGIVQKYLLQSIFPRSACARCMHRKIECTFDADLGVCKQCHASQVKCQIDSTLEGKTLRKQVRLLARLNKLMEERNDLVDDFKGAKGFVHPTRTKTDVMYSAAKPNSHNGATDNYSGTETLTAEGKIWTLAEETHAGSKYAAVVSARKRARSAKSTQARSSANTGKTVNEDLGLVNVDFFPPNPALERDIILNHEAPHILRCGLVSPAEVEKLFTIYWDYMNLSVSLLDPGLYSAQQTYWRSPFLFTVICGIASRFYSARPKLYQQVMHYARLAAGTALIVGQKNVECVHAYILLSLYPVPARKWEDDRSWVYLGVAIQIATELNLHHPSTEKPKDEMHAREILNRTRTWLNCFNLDRSISSQYGKAPIISNTDYIANHSAQWWNSSPYNMKNLDIRLAAYSAELTIVGKFRAQIHSDTDSPTGSNKSLDLAALALETDDELSRLYTHWLGLLHEHTDINGVQSKFQARLLRLEYSYARMSVLAFGFQCASKKTSTGLDVTLFWRCLRAALDVLDVILEVVAAADQHILLRHCPEAQTVLVIFACIVLLELMRPRYAFYVSDDQRLKIHDLIEAIANALGSPEVAVDDQHGPKLYSSFMKGFIVDRLASSSKPADSEDGAQRLKSTPKTPSVVHQSVTMKPVQAMESTSARNDHASASQKTEILSELGVDTPTPDFFNPPLPLEPELLQSMSAHSSWPEMSMPGFAWFHQDQQSN